MIFLPHQLENMQKYLLFLTLISIISCCKDDKKDSNITKNNMGEITSLPYLWKYQLNKDGIVNFNPTLDNNMVFGRNLIIPTTENSKSRSLTMLNSNDGTIVWNWKDWFQSETEGGDFTWDVRFNNNLHWTTGSRRYTINLENGANIFKYRNPDLFSFSSRIHSDESEIYFTSQTKTNDGYIVWPIYKGNIYNENYSVILKLPFNKDTLGVENRTKATDWIVPLESLGKKLLFILSSQSYQEWYYDQRVNLYNLTDSTWIYRDIIAAKPKQNNSGWSKSLEGKFYFTAGQEMFCFEMMTGKQLWKREFPHDFTFSGFEIEDNIMVANCENQRTYGINVNTGMILWESEGSGTSSRLQNRIMNGIAYFSGGGPQYIFAKDIATGQTIWKLDPNLFEEGGTDWRKELNVIPAQNGEKAKVVVCSKRYAYCFEAVR